MSPKPVGIEYLNVYGGSCYLDQRALAVARGLDPDRVVKDFLIEQRAVNPLFEDVITMAVNAAKPLLANIDPAEIGLLVVGTESSVDYGKPISTNIHAALELSPNVRNFETKHACYSGNAAMQVASDWIASGAHRGRKALIISSDASRVHLNSKEEFVLGGSAAAAIISDTPAIFRFERDAMGTWTSHVYDTYRPTSHHEIGNNELSLYSYLDALTGSYEHYCEQIGKKRIDFDKHFQYNIFHTPFPGMAMQAHRTLYKFYESHPKQEVRADFEKRVYPTLLLSQMIGSSYGASSLSGLASLFSVVKDIQADARVGIFSYGSGCIGEFYSGFVGNEAVKRLTEMKIEQRLQERFALDVPTYEEIERKRAEMIDVQDYTAVIDQQSPMYRAQYANQGKYILIKIDDFKREYRWS